MATCDYFFSVLKILFLMMEFSECNSLLFLWLFLIWPVVYLHFFHFKLFISSILSFSRFDKNLFISIFTIHQNISFRKDKRCFFSLLQPGFFMLLRSTWETPELFLKKISETVAYAQNSCEDTEQRMCSWRRRWDTVEW